MLSIGSEAIQRHQGWGWLVGKFLEHAARFTVGFSFAAVMAGCRIDGSPQPSSPPNGSALPSSVPEIQSDYQPGLGLTNLAVTHQQISGNRVVGGKGGIGSREPVRIPLQVEPRWLLGAEWGQGSLWVVVDAVGIASPFFLRGGEWVVSELSFPRLPVGTPPILSSSGGEIRLLQSLVGVGSILSHPIALKGGEAAVIGEGGGLFLSGEQSKQIEGIDPLLDARLTLGGDNVLAVISGPTDRYGHGVLGDSIEGSGISLIDLERGSSMKTWHLDPAEVIEGIAPILADFDDDGAMEILVTISDPQQGARYVLYDQQGGRIASSQPIGRGFRWRHQIAVGPFGESGELELAGLRTPHINGTVEFFRLEGTSLRLVAELEGYSSHELGSRNLDMALAGDFNGDGQLEVVVPREDFEGLAGIQRTAAGVEVVWTVELGGKLASNLMGLETEAGGLLLGAATQEGELLIWMP